MNEFSLRKKTFFAFLDIERFYLLKSQKYYE